MKFINSKATRLAITIAMYALIAAGCKENGIEESKKEETQPAPVTESKVTMPGQQKEDAFAKLPDVVATVNGAEISRSDLQKIHSMLATQVKMSSRAVSPEEIMDMALTELINMQVLKQESERQKISPSPEDIKKELGNIKANFPDEEAFKKAISEKNLTVEEIEKSVTQQLAVQTIIKKEVEEKISVSDSEIKKFYQDNPDYFKTDESVKASHILVKVDEKAEESAVAEAKKKIEDILARVKKGEDFAEAAKKSSEGPSGPNGGDLGYFTRGKMVKPFDETAFKLKKGEISDIIRTQFGFHIIKVVDKKEAGQTPMADVKEKIESFLKKSQGEKLFNDYVEKLRTAAAIERRF
ncbi:MAG: peptidylprolyl isomerase [Deltaproteobacteria bacterium]|nr:peptidylprolyl isomerase [Deltaproteobacteria bacterium]